MVTDNKNTPNITLHNRYLSVEIAKPGSVYTGARFDWTGFITQVKLGNRHTFCAHESLVPGRGTGGIGLCSEFGIEIPVGYNEAQPGEAFPKLGVGLLKRPNKGPYHFYRPYEIVERFPIKVTTQVDVASFVVEPVPCRGYAAQLSKTIRLYDNQLEITCSLANTGEKTIVTREYYHNFVGIDNQLVGSDYCLNFPYFVRIENKKPAVLNVYEKKISFKNKLAKDFYCRLDGHSRTEKAQWELVLTSNGTTMREYDDFTPARVAVWGTRHVISPEIFIDIHLQPGRIKNWTRRYEFIGSN